MLRSTATAYRRKGFAIIMTRHQALGFSVIIVTLLTVFDLRPKSVRTEETLRGAVAGSREWMRSEMKEGVD